MVEKVKPVTQIYKKTDLNKEDRRKFIKRVFELLTLLITAYANSIL